MVDKKVLVTGGSGFIGSHLVRRLMGEGASVAVMVRYGNVMKNERLKDIWDRIVVIEADLRNRGALEAIRAFQPAIVYHLAAYNHVGQSFGQVEECFDVNGKGSANLLDLSHDVDRFIYMSTSEVYGYQEDVPFVETMTPKPLSPYAITKYAGELYCRMRQRMSSSPSVVIVRSFNTYGPYQSAKAIIPELIIKCLRGEAVRTTLGEQTREFNFVSDIVDGLVRAGNYSGEIDGALNIAGGEEVSIADLVNLIAEVTQSTSAIEIGALPYRPTEIWRMYAESSRAREALGWAPQVRLKDGLIQTVDWFRHYLRNDGSAT